MPFSQILFLFRSITRNYTFLKKSCRKERELGYIFYFLSCVLKKAPVSTFLKTKADCSVTVEAVICIPLFLYASICMIWMLELRALQLTVRCALQEAGKNLTIELAEIPVLIPSVLEADIQNIIGQERLANSFLVNGVQCDKSYVRAGTGIMELSAKYAVKLPFPQFAIPPIEYEEEMRMKIWNGYKKNSIPDLSMDTTVYITDTGIVYHKDPRCTYLEPSVKQVGINEIDELRNSNGAKYYACGLCGGFINDVVYVTDYGTRYHSSLLCSRVKRNVYAVSLQEVKGKGACSKCGE